MAMKYLIGGICGAVFTLAGVYLWAAWYFKDSFRSFR